MLAASQLGASRRLSNTVDAHQLKSGVDFSRQQRQTHPVLALTCRRSCVRSVVSLRAVSLKSRGAKRCFRFHSKCHQSLESASFSRIFKVRFQKGSTVVTSTCSQASV